MKRSTARRLKALLPEVVVVSMIIIFVAMVVLRYAGCIDGRERGSMLEDGEVAVHVIDVGQGDCILIETVDGVVLVDSGTDDSEQVLLEYLEELDIDTVDYLIITHAHDDHLGGADMILESFNVKKIMRGGDGYPESLDAMISERGCEEISARFGYEWTVGDARFSVISPDTYEYGEDLNDHSIVIRMECGETDFIFTGDATANTEKNILDALPAELLDCDFLKSGHHGSATSSSVEFINVLSPEIVAISCGENNSYGLPDGEVLEIYESVGAKCYRTDVEGTMVFITDGYEIIKEKGGAN